MLTLMFRKLGIDELFALTLHNGSVVDESSLGPFPYQDQCDSIAYAPDGYVYYNHFGGGRNICRARLGTPNEVDGHYGGELVYEHSTWIDDLGVRPIGTENDYRVYFTSYVSPETRAFYFLDGQNLPVPYRRPDGSTLVVSGTDMAVPFIDCAGIADACISWDGTFAFGESPPTLYLATGFSYYPAGLFRMSGAGPDQVTGSLERLLVVERNIRSLVWANGILYYISDNYMSGQSTLCNLYQFDPATLQEALVYSTADDIRDMAAMPELLTSWGPPDEWQLGVEWESVRVIDEALTVRPRATTPPTHPPGGDPRWSTAIERRMVERVIMQQWRARRHPRSAR